jgi:hypothetical protein
MVKLRILKNMRKPFPFFIFPVPVFIWKKKSFEIIKNFNFDNSAIYHFDDADQADVNKLFGFSIGYHHNNSFRFGWRPTVDLLKIEIVGYEYHDKIRISTIHIVNVEVNKWYKYVMAYNADLNLVEYSVIDENNLGTEISSSIELQKNLSWGYKLGLYFGGNKKAPHNITIYKK